MTLPINQTPARFLSEFFNLKHYTVHNISEAETPDSPTHEIYLPSDRARVKHIRNNTMKYQFKEMLCSLLLVSCPDREITSVTIKLKVFPLL